MENKKPKHYLILKIVGFIFAAVAIAGFVLTFIGFGEDGNMFIIGGVMVCFGLFIGILCLSSGFSPEMTKLATKSAKYIQQQNKADLTDIANTNADISGEAVTKTAKAIKKGLSENTKFCIHCGEEIPESAIFCSKCGEKQEEIQ